MEKLLKKRIAIDIKFTQSSYYGIVLTIKSKKGVRNE